MENEKIAVGIAAIVVLLAGAYFLLGQVGTPDLAVDFSYSPQEPYAGDIVEFTITVTNLGNAKADGAILDFEINGASVAQKQITLEPGESEAVVLNWLASSEGETSISVNANKGNIVSENNFENSVHSGTITALPSENIRIFENLPEMNITNAYEFHITRAGMSQLTAILASSESENQAIYSTLYNKFGEAHLAITHYSNGSEIAFMHTKPEMTPDDARAVFQVLSGEFLGEFYDLNITKDGRDVAQITSADALTTICLWREKGWTKSLMYKRYFPELQVGSIALGDDTSCEDLIGMRFNPEPAEEKLRGVADLLSAVSISDPPLVEASAKLGAEALYILGFYDENSAFVLRIATVLSPRQDRCMGELIQQDGFSICHVDSAQLLGGTYHEAFIRRQGGVVIGVFIIPFQGTDVALARQKAVETAKSISYPGIPEYDWSGQGQAQVTTCRFESGLACSAPKVENATVSLSITHIQGSPIRLNGFRCTQLSEEPAYDISLPEPVIIPANESAELSFRCYIDRSEPFSGEIWFMRGYAYANFTDLDTNETRMVRGNILINSPPGSG